MEFEKVIRERQSTRSFSDKKIDKEIIEKILNAGRIAPTAKNLQPQKIYVISSEEGFRMVDSVTPCRYNAQLSLLVCSDKNIAWSNGDYSSYEMDSTIVATHMILEATNLGIDSVWVRMFDREKVREVFKIEDNIIPICFIQLGYKSDDCKDSPMHNIRKSLDEEIEYI